jgi:hypothetical protein
MLSLKEKNDKFPKYCGLKRTGMMDCVQNIRQKDCFMSSYTKFRLRLDGMFVAITTYFTRPAVGLKCMYVCLGLSVRLEFPEQQQFVHHLQII